ncbi:MAG: hypothetical protein OJF51_004967 [Nitrospira sp.]|jgi:hypothetical protein|nr:MAG: hypothetical protein OJF51_004967 [Nitrospira sp.]
MSPFLHQLTAQIYHPETKGTIARQTVPVLSRGYYLKDEISGISGVNVEPASMVFSRGSSAMEDIILRDIARGNYCRHHQKNLCPSVLW